MFEFTLICLGLLLIGLSILVTGLLDAESRPAAAGRTGSLVAYLAATVRCNLPLADALDACGRDPTAGAAHRRALVEVVAALEEGAPLADALDRAPLVFERSLRVVVRASEAAGCLGPVLGRLASLEVADRLDARRAAGHLAYPLLVGFLVGLGHAMARLTIGTSVDPMILVEVLAAGTLVAEVVLVAVVVRVLVAPRWLVRWEAARRTRPFEWPLGRLARRRALGRFGLVAGELLAAGLPAGEALALAGQAADHPSIARIVGRAADRVAEGAPVDRALRQADVGRAIPEDVHWHVEVGQASGRLAEALVEAGRRSIARGRREIELLYRTLLPIGVGLSGLAFLSLACWIVGLYIDLLAAWQ